MDTGSKLSSRRGIARWSGGAETRLDGATAGGTEAADANGIGPGHQRVAQQRDDREPGKPCAPAIAHAPREVALRAQVFVPKSPLTVDRIDPGDLLGAL